MYVNMTRCDVTRHKTVINRLIQTSLILLDIYHSYYVCSYDALASTVKGTCGVQIMCHNKGIEAGSPWHAVYNSSNKNNCAHVSVSRARVCVFVCEETEEDGKVPMEDHQFALIANIKIFILQELNDHSCLLFSLCDY